MEERPEYGKRGSNPLYPHYISKEQHLMHGKKPTARQRKVMAKNGLDTREWLVLKCPSDCLVLVHKESQEEKTIPVLAQKGYYR